MLCGKVNGFFSLTVKLAPSLTGSVTVGKLLKLSVPLFLY